MSKLLYRQQSGYFPWNIYRVISSDLLVPSFQKYYPITSPLAQLSKWYWAVKNATLSLNISGYLTPGGITDTFSLIGSKTFDYSGSPGDSYNRTSNAGFLPFTETITSGTPGDFVFTLFSGSATATLTFYMMQGSFPPVTGTSGLVTEVVQYAPSGIPSSVWYPHFWLKFASSPVTFGSDQTTDTNIGSFMYDGVAIPVFANAALNTITSFAASYVINSTF